MFRDAICEGAQWPSGFRPINEEPFPGWKANGKPEWADDYGTDQYGAWVTFSVVDGGGAPVTQRLRWCQPGSFIMGSQAKEKERFNNETPSRDVTIRRGFWMFETACTEALWKVVTGRVPDVRRGPSFPVTDVSWHDARDFIQTLNTTKLRQAFLTLPSEAQWEYACRSGTQTPYSSGARASRDQICFDSDAPVPTGSLPPNRWGLHEMQGNIWEWCADHWNPNYDDAPSDGSAWVNRTSEIYRAARGGYWADNARAVRAASRDGFDPASRYNKIGFRCSGVQTSIKRSRAGRREASDVVPRQATSSP